MTGARLVVAGVLLEPGDRDDLPDAATAPPAPATDLPFVIDLAALTVSEPPTG